MKLFGYQRMGTEPARVWVDVRVAVGVAFLALVGVVAILA